MKKFLSLFLAVVFTIGTLLAAPIQLPGLVVFASAEETTVPNQGETGNNGDGEATPAPESFLRFQLNEQGDGYIIISYDGPACDELVIPAEYNGKPVTIIGIMAFSTNTKIKKVVLPETLKRIEYQAFDSSSLEEIVIPESVTHIGQYAFQYCSNLKSIKFPSKIKTIEAATCYGCKNLTQVIIPDGVQNIYIEAFANCNELETIEIPDSVTTIDRAFTGTKLFNDKSKWENGALYIGKHLIATNDTIGEMYRVKDGTIHISCNAFENRKKLLAVYVPKTVKVIDDSVFNNCTSLTFMFYEGTVEEFNKIDFNNNEVYLENTIIISEATGSGIPAKPTIKKVSNVAGGVQISWDEVDNADVYLVWRRGSGNSEWTLLGMTDQTTAIDTSAGHRQYWRYSVQGMNFDEVSDFDYTGKYLKYVATPKLTGISNATNGIYFKWNAVSGASGYRVYRRAAGAKYWTYLGTVKGTSYTDKTVKNASGNYYRYTVRAVVDGVYSGFEDFLFTKRLANPTLKSATNGNGGITVKWSAVKGTTGYYVYRKTANSNWVRIGAVGGTNNTTFLDKTAKSGTTYTYTVRAVYGGTTSYFNSGISCKRK